MRNKDVKAVMRVALIEEKIQGDHLRWFGYVDHIPINTSVRQVKTLNQDMS